MVIAVLVISTYISKVILCKNKIKNLVNGLGMVSFSVQINL